ncbi:hypothetical protein SMA75_20120 [Escherichia coli]|uniref:hypothetical protein n=1 Tax=Escherichia coli TaxID=562 RepID=UPI0030792CE8
MPEEIKSPSDVEVSAEAGPAKVSAKFSGNEAKIGAYATAVVLAILAVGYIIASH